MGLCLRFEHILAVLCEMAVLVVPVKSQAGKANSGVKSLDMVLP